MSAAENVVLFLFLLFQWSENWGCWRFALHISNSHSPREDLILFLLLFRYFVFRYVSRNWDIQHAEMIWISRPWPIPNIKITVVDAVVVWNVCCRKAKIFSVSDAFQIINCLCDKHRRDNCISYLQHFVFIFICKCPLLGWALAFVLTCVSRKVSMERFARREIQFNCLWFWREVVFLQLWNGYFSVNFKQNIPLIVPGTILLKFQWFVCSVRSVGLRCSLAVTICLFPTKNARTKSNEKKIEQNKQFIFLLKMKTKNDWNDRKWQINWEKAIFVDLKWSMATDHGHFWLRAFFVG